MNLDVGVDGRICEVKIFMLLFQELFMTAQQVFRQQDMDHQLQVIIKW